MRKLQTSNRFTRRLRVEPLEARRVLATFMVTSLADGPVSFPGAAPGTLRQAIYDANHTAGADVIQFDSGLSGTINLSIADDVPIAASSGQSALVVTSPITIKGNTGGITIARNSAAAEMRLFHVFSTGDLTVDSVSITNGLLRGLNGATPGDAGTEARGGAIYNEGILRVVASTLYANQVIGGNGGTSAGGGSGRGGAIYNDGGTLTVTDATFSGNMAKSGTGVTSPSSFGGAIYDKNGSVGVYNSTLTNGTASTGRGLYVLAQNGTATVDIWSSIIAQEDAPLNDRDFLTAPDVNGQMTVTGGNNLIRVQGDYQTITVSTDNPMLDVLANNGGPTMTHALLAGSPAINLGSNVKSLGTDQRGASYARVVGGVADIGSFEMQSITSPVLLGDYNGNSVVDAADYVLWRHTVGNNVSRPFAGADGDGSGAVDAPDYGVWRSHFGLSAATGSSSIESAAISQPAPKSTFAIVAFSPSVLLESVPDSSFAARPTLFSSRNAGTLALLELCDAMPSRAKVFASGIAKLHVQQQSTAANGESELGDALWSAWADV